MRPCILVAPFFVVLGMSAAFVSSPAGMGKHHRGSQVQHGQSQSHHDHDGRYVRLLSVKRLNGTKRRGGGGRGWCSGSCLSASVAEQERKGPEARKLNPLETIIKVYTEASQRSDARPDRQYPFFTGLPLKPYFDRKTLRTEEIPDVMWSFEQPQEFFNVSVNIRMTAVRMEEGGLWIHAPVAPTEECIRLVEELGEEVRYIVLPTTAFEHKVYVKPFSDRFPRAKVYVCPGQWSWPVNLPPRFRVDGTLCEVYDWWEGARTRLRPCCARVFRIPRHLVTPLSGPVGLPFMQAAAEECVVVAAHGERAPWEGEIECKLFSPPIGGVGPSNEVIFFHKATRTLLVTDCVICIPRDPPPIIGVDGLLQAAAEEGLPPLPDSPESRRQGWAKMCLQVLFLGPALPTTFAIVSEKLVVSPVLRTLTLKRVLPYVKEFVSGVCEDWPDVRGFLSCHYSGRVPATTRDFRTAFGFAFGGDGGGGGSGGGSGGANSNGKAETELEGLLQTLRLGWLTGAAGGGGGGAGGDGVDPLLRVPEEDLATLNSVNDFVVRYGLADPDKDDA